MFEKFLSKVRGRTEAEVDIVRSEHLKEGVSPIVACVENTDSEESVIEKLSDKQRQKAFYVNYYEPAFFAENKDIITNDDGIYFISPVNERDKYSFDYRNCTGVIAVGISKRNRKNISFLTHQHPIALRNRNIRQLFVKEVSGNHTSIRGRHDWCCCLWWKLLCEE